jgi:hypothetical protein
METTVLAPLSTTDEFVKAETQPIDALRELSALELALIGGGTISGTYL